MVKRSGAALISLLVGMVVVRGVAAQAASRTVVGAGASTMEFDLNNDRVSRGIVLRGGMAPAWPVDVEVVGQYWPDLGFYRAGSVVLEATMYPAGRSRVTPFVVFGVGYFSATDRFGLGLSAEQGITKTFGVGVAGRVWRSWGLRLDGSVRFDPHAFDDELRLGVVRSPGLPRPDGLRTGGARLALYSLTPVSGPWHVVEPGFGLSFWTPLARVNDVDMDVVLLHWHTESSAVFSGWDTRALLVLPAFSWVSQGSGIQWHVGGGPAATLMFEGPDDGLRGGVHAGASCTIPLGSGISASLGVTALWLFRADNPAYSVVSQLPGTDERALLFRLGVGR